MKKRLKSSLQFLFRNLSARIFSENEFGVMAKSVYPNLSLICGDLTYAKDGLFTIHNTEFLSDTKFKKAYELGRGTGSWGDSDIQFRAYVACWFANLVKGLDGDFVECGVNKGGLSRAIIEYIDFNSLNKTFYLLDTYQGLSAKYLTTSESNRNLDQVWNKHYSDCYNEVKETFKNFNAQIIKGPVPETLSQVPSERVAYLSIDMNCVIPEIEAFKFFWPKIVNGGVVVLDDYAYKGQNEQKVAFDKLSQELDFSILTLPTGQGLIFKIMKGAKLH
jgi:hypothetical protein